MGDFLLIQSNRNEAVKGRQIFQRGVEIGTCVKSLQPKVLQESPGLLVAVFPRQNGTGGHFTSDEESKCWLLAIGNWFHEGGYRVGDEAYLLRDYLRVGPERLVKELEGFFLIVIYDQRTQEVVVLTDLVGSCHGFMRTWNHSAALSGSSFLLASLSECHLDPVGCQEFLYGGVIYENRSFFKNIRKFGPATIFKFADGRLKSEQKYWKITDVDLESLDGEAAVSSLAETVIQAVRKIGKIYPHPVCDLTGGYDSRALVSAILKAGVKFSTTVSGPAGSNDVKVAGGLAQLKGLSHLHIPPDGTISFSEIKNAFVYTDGEYDLLEYAKIFRVQHQLSVNFDISLNGSFGEIGRGYWWELLYPYAGKRPQMDSERLARLRYGAQPFVHLASSSPSGIDFISHLTEVIERTNSGLQFLPNTSQMDHAYLVMRMQRWQGRIASSTNRLWPCLSPFLFRSVLETMLKIVVPLRQKSLLIRKMIESLDPSMAKFPLEHGCPALPVRWDTVLRFWPLPVHYGKKVFGKLSRVLNISPAKKDQFSRLSTLRTKLWEDEEVRELFEQKNMKTRALFDDDLLKKLVDQARTPDFAYHDQWARLLSLEYTLHRLNLQNHVGLE